MSRSHKYQGPSYKISFRQRLGARKLCNPVFYKSPLKTVSTLLRFSSVPQNKINPVCLSLLVTSSLYATDLFCQGMIPFVRACTFAFDRVSLAYCPSVRLSVLSLSPCSCKAPERRICVTSLQPIEQATTQYI